MKPAVLVIGLAAVLATVGLSTTVEFTQKAYIAKIYVGSQRDGG